PAVLERVDVDADPVGHVLVGADSSPRGPLKKMAPHPFQFTPNNRNEGPPRADRVSPAADVLPEALHSVDGKQFFEFARKSHEGTMQRSSPETSMALRRNLESVHR